MPTTTRTPTGFDASDSALPGSGTLTRTVVSTLPELRNQLLDVTRAAEHNLVIYAAELSAELYAQPAFLDALKHLVLARRYARVRILTSALPHQLSPRHPLLSMAERLTSLMEIRTVPTDILGATEFVIADHRAIVYRLHRTRWDGMADLNDTAVAKFYLAQFDAMWHAALAADEPPESVGL